MKFTGLVLLFFVAYAVAMPIDEDDEDDDDYSWEDIVEKAYSKMEQILKVLGDSDEYESPPYKMIKDHGRFEEREYEGDHYWACTTRPYKSKKDMGRMFMELFQYIDGDNADELEIPMTIPVNRERGSSNEQTMCFYLGTGIQGAPPAPTDSDIFIEKRDKMTVYTRKRGGYMSERKWNREHESLSRLVSSSGLNFDTDKHYVNCYNSPIKFWNRRNELWLIKADDIK